MSITIPQWLALLLVGVGLVGIALTLIVTIRAYIQSRRGEYYVIRGEGRRRALRTSLVLLILILLTVVFLFIPRQTSSPQPTPTATMGRTLTSVPTPTRTMSTVTAAATSTPQATATEPFIPTLTPQATLPVTLTQPLPSAIPPPGDARFEFWTLALDVDENNQPVNPTTELPFGTERVYLFFRYDGLLPNVPWSVVWYQDGEYLSGGTRLWESERPVGERHEFLDLAGGYPVGEYEVQVWLGGQLQIRAAFTVVENGG
jgi:hypothetical protein